MEASLPWEADFWIDELGCIVLLSVRLLVVVVARPGESNEDALVSLCFDTMKLAVEPSGSHVNNEMRNTQPTRCNMDNVATRDYACRTQNEHDCCIYFA